MKNLFHTLKPKLGLFLASFVLSCLLFTVIPKAILVYKERKDAASREETIRSNIGKYVVAPHVIKINITDMTDIPIGSGTGFYLKYLGKIRIITNKHICDQSEGPRKLRGDLNKRLKILHISTAHDLCVIESDRLTGLELALNDVSNLDKVILVGHPRGLPVTIREGYKIETSYEFFPWIGPMGKSVNYSMISAISYPGNSGSPVTNSNGEVIGVLFAGDSRYVTEGYIVPYEDLVKFLSRTYKL